MPGRRGAAGPVWRRRIAAVAMAGVVAALATASAGAGRAGAAAPTDLHVTTAGNDANPCTQARPCASVQRAVDVAASTATIHVGPGTFSSAINVTSGTVTIIGDPAGTTLETASGTTVTVSGTADLTLDGLVVHSNGTGIAQNGGALTVTASTIDGNRDFGIDESGGTLTVIDSTIVGNGDAGLFNGGGTMAITSSTIAGNTDFGIEKDETLFGVITLAGSVLAGNDFGDCDVGTIVDGGFNLADDSSCPFGRGTGSRNGVTGLGLSALAFLGGPTPVEMPAQTSPAVNAIPAGNPLCTGTDQRGVARPQGSGCDAGAVELAATTVTVTASPNPARPGQAVTLTIHVTPTPTTPANLPRPAGTVSLGAGGSPIAGCTGLTLAAGSASCQASGWSSGQHVVGAAYAAATTSPYLAGTGSGTVTVGAPPLITSPDTATFTIGTTGTFTVITTGIPAPTLTESGALPQGVRFTDNGDGTATITGTPATGTARGYSLALTATNALGKAHQSLTLTVAKAKATVAVSVDPATPVTGQPMTITVHVTGAAGTPTGTVRISDPSTGTLVNGSAGVTVTAPAAGPVTVTAAYHGDSTYAAATGTLGIVVAAAPPTPSRTSPPPTQSPTSPSSPTAPPATSASQATSSLASTGSNLRLPLIAGLILLTAGVAVLTRTRRSRRH